MQKIGNTVSSNIGSLVWLLAIGAGISAANNYYNQPLLPQIASDFHVSFSQIGIVAGATQLGYASGLFFISPLGDKFERKSIIFVLSIGLIFSLAVAGLAPFLSVLIVASFFIGLFATIVQQLIPLAASFSNDKNRGAVVGTVMTGMTCGILLARTLSGSVGQFFGWRSMFFLAAILVFCLLLALMRKLPKSIQETSLSYPQLLTSMLTLFARLGVLREAAIVGALWFACFGAIWATMASHLLEAFGYGPAIAGLFGLVGASGALAARFSGQLADRFGPRPILFFSLLLMLASFILLWFEGQAVSGLIFGIIFLDIGVFAAQVANQTRIFALEPTARSRINAIYMVFYYGGGSIGSILGIWLWQSFGWNGVCLLGIAFICTALVIHSACSSAKSHN